MKKIKVILSIIMIIIITLLLVQPVKALHTAYKVDIYADQNYGEPTDLDEAKNWQDISESRYGETKATKQDLNDGVTEYLNGQTVDDEELARVTEYVKGVIEENYSVALENEMNKLNKLIYESVKDKDVEAMDGETLSKYIKCLNAFSKNPGLVALDDFYASMGSGSIVALNANERAIKIQEKYADRLTEEDNSQLEEIKDTTTEIVNKDQTALMEHATNDDGHLDETYSISGIIIRGENAGTTGDGETDSPVDNPDSYNPGSVEVSSNLVEIGGVIVGAIKIVGIIVAIIMTIVLGIKYMIGSVSEKAEYKKVLVPYLAGIILLAAGGTILEILFNLVAGTGIND